MNAFLAQILGAKGFQSRTLSDGALERDRQNDCRRPRAQMDADLVCSDGLRIAVALRAAAKSAAQRPTEAAHKRADPARKGEAHRADAIALERRKLRVKVVNPEPHRQRRIPSVEVR
jgi:hypothetical protein